MWLKNRKIGNDAQLRFRTSGRVKQSTHTKGKREGAWRRVKTKSQHGLHDPGDELEEEHVDEDEEARNWVPTYQSCEY